MSGFAVHVGSDRPASSDQVGQMVAGIQGRGPDGVTVHQLDNVTLVHGQFITTAEARLEVQPLHHATRPWWLVADVRIDNRDDLRAELAGTITHPLVTDPDFVMGAYERWGHRAAEHLIGDFAYAIWDGERKTLAAGRDHIGVRPLYWATALDGSLAVGSTIPSVLNATGVDLTPDICYLADYGRSMSVDPAATPYVHVHRVPGGHVMTASMGHAPVVERFWFLDVARRRVDTATAAAEVSRLFHQAVAARVRSDRPVAAQVSGGFDSTSVAGAAVAIAGRDQVVGVAVVFPGLDCDESSYIDAASAAMGIYVHRLDAPACGPYDFADEVRRTLDLPSTPDSKWFVPLDRMCASLGCRVVLDGQCGDHLLIGSLEGAATGLLTRGHPLRWWRLMHRAGFTGASAAKYTAREAARAMVFMLPAAGTEAIMSRFRRSRTPGFGGFIRADVVGSAPVPLPRPMPGGWKRTRTHRQANYLGDMSWFVDLWDRLSIPSGVEARHPFLDIRLIEYVLSLGEDMVTAGDLNRGLHRLALAHGLPSATLNRSDKASFNEPWVRAALSIARSLGRLRALNDDRWNELLELDPLEASLAAIEHDPWPADGVWGWWNSLSLCLWLGIIQL